MEVKVYNQEAKDAGNIKLSDDLFGLEWNDELVHQVAVSMMSNKRVAIAHTKGRGEVRGGGKKPWRQKGTGRARHGSIRSPIWVGGGVAHGPSKDKNYSKKINKKMKRKAFFTAFSQKIRDNEVIFVDKLTLNNEKTKEAAGILKNLSGVKGFEKLSTKRKNRAVLALDKKESKIDKSFRNISGMYVSGIKSVNLLDLLTYKYVVVVDPKASLKDWK